MPATHHANQIMQRLLKPANPVADIAVMHQAVLEAIRNSGVVPSMPQVISRLMEAISDPEFKYAAVGPCAISAGLAASRFDRELIPAGRGARKDSRTSISHLLSVRRVTLRFTSIMGISRYASTKNQSARLPDEREHA